MARINFTSYSKGYQSEGDFYTFQQAVAGMTGKNTGGAQVEILDATPWGRKSKRYKSIKLQVSTVSNEFFEFELGGNFKYKKNKGIYQGRIREIECNLAGGGSYSVQSIWVHTNSAGNIFADIQPKLIRRNDTIIGSTKTHNTINAGPGNDKIISGPGSLTQGDLLYGGSGRDQFDLTLADKESGSAPTIMDYFSDKSVEPATRDYITLSGGSWDEYYQDYWGETYDEIYTEETDRLVASIYYSNDSLPDLDGNYGLYAAFSS